MSEREPEAATQRVATSDTEQPRPTLADRPGAGPTAPAGQNVRRFWSTRRVPAVIVSLLAAAATGLLLYDVTAVRAGRPAMSWRRTLADELATRPLDDGWMIGGAVLAMVVGLWLLILSVTPGLRWLLPMRPPADARSAGIRAGPNRSAPDIWAVGIRAGLSRSAVALVLRDRAMEVPGVQSARIDVGRRRIRARIRSHFRDLEEVRADLESTLANGIQQLGLARPPSLSLDVRRPKKR